MWLAVLRHSIRDGGDWLDLVPAALLPGKSPLGAGWAMEPVWTLWKKGEYFVPVRNETVIPWLSIL
jgi:hypothetical protein